jgi:hypothetical protein
MIAIDREIDDGTGITATSPKQTSRSNLLLNDPCTRKAFPWPP